MAGSRDKLAQCCREKRPDSAHERSHSEPCAQLARAEGFVGGHPAVTCTGRRRWILLPRHYRRVLLAAGRAASTDEVELCDDWIIGELKRVRQGALAAGYSRADVDAWTMEGCIGGRREAAQRASAGRRTI